MYTNISKFVTIKRAQSFGQLTAQSFGQFGQVVECSFTN